MEEEAENYDAFSLFSLLSGELVETEMENERRERKGVFIYRKIILRRVVEFLKCK